MTAPTNTNQSDNASQNIKKPAIAIGACFAALCFAVLKFPGYFLVILICAIIVAALFAFSLRKTKAVAIITFICIISGAVIPYITYLSKEPPAQNILSAYTDDTTFTGKVTYFNSSGSYSGFDVEVTAIDGKLLNNPVNIHTYCFSADYAKVGDTITFTGTPESVYDSETSDFDTVSYLRSKKIFIVVPGAVINSSQANQNKGVIENLRTYIDNTYAKYLPDDFDYTTYSVAKALVLGDKEHVDNDLENDFRRSGTLHLLCVSGMHLTVILGFAFCFLKMLKVRKKVSAVLIISLCVFYVILTGVMPSILRAGIMSCISYIAMFFGKKSDGTVSLFVAAAVMCSFDPYIILSISAQLSFLATLGIIMGVYVCEKLTIKSKILTSLLTGVFAVCFTLPLSAFSFGGIPVFSVITTVLTSPLCDIALILLILLILISPLSFLGVFDAICMGLAWVCNLLLNGFVKVSEFFSDFKFSYVPFPEYFSGIVLVFFSALAIISVFMYAGRKKPVKIMCGCILTLSVAAVVTSLCLCIHADKQCHVYYYRKNASDIQINVKLGSHGTLMINNDNVLCTNPEKIPFDDISQSNYMLIVPEENISPKILSHNIQTFDKRFGIKQVYIVNTPYAAKLQKDLESCGVKSQLTDGHMQSGDVYVSVSQTQNSTGYKINVYDSKQHVCAVVANEYNVLDYSTPNAINAFFTSQTKNQFKQGKDILPESKAFYARLKKDETAKGIQNIFGQNSIMLY